MFKKNKYPKTLIILAILLGISGLIGTSYAIWQVYWSQSTTNTITAKCFNNTFTDGEEILFNDMLPMTDTEGMELNPYTFTLENTCELNVKYQVNIEVLNNSTLNPEYVKLGYHIDDYISLLSTNTEVTPTLSNISNSYKIAEGVLGTGESIERDIRLWLEENTTIAEGQSKTFQAKITITTTSTNDSPIADITFPMLRESESNPTETSAFLGSPSLVTRNNIESIVFEDHMNIPNDVIGTWDVSAAQDESVIAWYTNNDSDSLYEITIGQTGGVQANPDSSYLFDDIRNLDILNLEYFNTSNVTNMLNMFVSTGFNSTVFTLDVSNFDTSKVTNMKSMFVTTGYNSPNFALNLSSFDTSNVTNMSQMFRDTGYNNLDFALDLRTFDFSKVTSYNDMLYNFRSANQIRVKDQASKDFILTTNIALTNVVIG